MSLGFTAPSGELSTKVIKGRLDTVEGELTVEDIIHFSMPAARHADWLNDWKESNRGNILRGLNKISIAREHEIPTFYGLLWAKHYDSEKEDWVDYGLVSTRVVTNAGVDFIVDAFQNTTEVENLKYHGIGTTDSPGEAVGDTALQAELSTVYNPDNTRATGSTVEGGGTNVYRTVGTNTVDGSAAIVEHGIFSQAATGGGTLLDRSVFSVINLSASDSLQTTYDLTFTAGS